MLPQLFHVRPHKHLTELDEVTVVLVVHLDNSPRVRTSTDLAAIRRGDEAVRTDHSERDFTGNLLGFRNGLLILIFIGGCLKDVNIVVSNICKNLRARHQVNGNIAAENEETGIP